MKKGQKVDKKKAQKEIVDRSFGMKNKKGASQQRTIKGITSQLMRGGMSEQKAIEIEHKKREDKKKEAEEQALMAKLYGNTSAKAGELTKKEAKEDPKKKVCAFFKQGLCQKGRKCKWSHDLSLEDHKTQQIDLYTDQREQMGGKENETSENWDTKKLEEVVNAQQNKYKSQKPTEIVCKFFLESVNGGKYGWNWVCPNGMTCHYRHCLPPGFILKKDVEKKKEEDLSRLEDKIDEQIMDLNIEKGAQKVTYEVFIEWKKKRDERREKEREAKLQEKVNKVHNKKKGVGKNHFLTGFALFQSNASMFQDDENDDGEDDIDYGKREDEDENDNNNRNNQQFEEVKEEEDEEEEEVKKEETKQEEKEEVQKQDGQQQEKKDGEDKKEEEEPLESWEQGVTDEQDKKKKKKKKKKKSGDVVIDKDVFKDEDV